MVFAAQTGPVPLPVMPGGGVVMLVSVVLVVLVAVVVGAGLVPLLQPRTAIRIEDWLVAECEMR